MKTDPRTFAIERHGEQTYGDDYPYHYHLDKVASIAEKYLNGRTVFFSGLAENFPETVMAVAYLHDVLEDTPTSFGDLEHFFGSKIADLVDNLTDVPGANRKIRKLNTWWKIRRSPISVYIKLCDRIANTSEAEKLDMYQKEYPLFEAALYQPGQFEEMWEDLKTLTFKKEMA